MSNIALLNHFDDAEVFAYLGNAYQSDGGKFNSKCAHFPDNTSFVSISNHSGLFNLNPNSSCEFEFFIKPYRPGRVNELQEQDMSNSGFRWFNGHSFLFLNNPQSWENAKALCEHMNGHLAVVDSQDKLDFLSSMLNGNMAAWIGASYSNSSLSWVDNSDNSFANWLDNYPAYDDSKVYLFNASKIAPYKFADGDGSVALPFIVEWDFDTRINSSPYSYKRFKQNYFFYGGHSFLAFSGKYTYAQAQAFCVANNAHLAAISSSEELAALSHYLLSFKFDGGWIGLHKNSGSWAWDNNEPLNYTPWGEGESFDPNADINNAAFIVPGDNFSAFYAIPDNNQFGFIVEWDYDLRTDDSAGNILAIGDDCLLSYTSLGSLRFQSNSWNFNCLSDLCLNDDWNHCLIRLNDETLTVFLNGYQAIQTNVSGNSIAPASIKFGGFIGYIDEFVFRTGEVETEIITPVVVPSTPYQINSSSAIQTSNDAPVTRVTWSCNNLPEGLSLSKSGLLTGTPTAAGTYDCNISVQTNWGTANKILRIVIN